MIFSPPVLALALKDTTTELLVWQEAAADWRLMATEALHALHAAAQREASLTAQCAALRSEIKNLRACAADRGGCCEVPAPLRLTLPVPDGTLGE